MLTSFSIKKGLRSAKGAKEFSLDTDSSSSESTNSELLKDTETTITVSWMGGGQVKDRMYIPIIQKQIGCSQRDSERCLDA